MILSMFSEFNYWLVDLIKGLECSSSESSSLSHTPNCTKCCFSSHVRASDKSLEGLPDSASTSVASTHFLFSHVRVEAPSRNIDRAPGATRAWATISSSFLIFYVSPPFIWKSVIFLIFNFIKKKVPPF